MKTKNQKRIELPKEQKELLKKKTQILLILGLLNGIIASGLLSSFFLIVQFVADGFIFKNTPVFLLSVIWMLVGICIRVFYKAYFKSLPQIFK